MSVNRFEKLLNHLSPQRSDFEPATETHIRQSSESYLAYGFLWGGEACCPTLECHICRGNLSNGAVDQSKLKRSVFMCVKDSLWSGVTVLESLGTTDLSYLFWNENEQLCLSDDTNIWISCDGPKCNRSYWSLLLNPKGWHHVWHIRHNDQSLIQIN